MPLSPIEFCKIHITLVVSCNSVLICSSSNLQMACRGNRCRARAGAPGNSCCSGLCTQTMHNNGVSRTRNTVQMDPEVYEGVSRGDPNLLDDLLKDDQSRNGRHEGNATEGTTVPSENYINRISSLSGVTWSGDTPLHIAARFGQTDMARKICEADRSFLMRTNKKSETSLHYAAQVGSIDMIDHFIEIARADDDKTMRLQEFLQKKNENGETALYQAVRHGHKDVVEKLMYVDVDLAYIPDNQEASPLYLAVVLNSIDVVIALVKNLPRENLPKKAYVGPDGRTALHAAALRNEEFVQQVLSLPAEQTKCADKSGSTPLHYAASVKSVGAMKLLLEKDRASAYTPNSCGLFPVHIAAKLGHTDVLGELFKHCPDSDELLDCQDRNFLHLAVLEKQEGVVKWICQLDKFQKAMNAQDKAGDTPLHLAVKEKDETIFAHLILSQRVHYSWVNKAGLTPLDIAGAQRKDAFSHWKNPEYVIYQTLGRVGCPFGIERAHHMKLENNVQTDDKKEVESYESMAKSMSTASVLIASAAFAAAFAVSWNYIDKRSVYNTPHLNLAFKVFVMMDAYAFLCSIIATGLLVEAALTFLDPGHRKKYLIHCTALVMMAAKGFIMAFATGVYVILNPFSKWLAILVSLTGVVGAAVIQPHHWPSLLVPWTAFKYGSWTKFLRNKNNIVPMVISAKPRTIKDIISKFELFRLCLDNLWYLMVVLLILTDSMTLWTSKKAWSQDVIVTVIILLLLLSCLLPIFSIIMERHLKPSKKVHCIV